MDSNDSNVALAAQAVRRGDAHFPPALWWGLVALGSDPRPARASQRVGDVHHRADFRNEPHSPVPSALYGELGCANLPSVAS